jgi:hypothetical protein
MMDFDTDQVLEGDIDTNTNTNAEASASGSNTETFPPNLAALPTKRGKNPTGINGKRPSRKFQYQLLLISSTINSLAQRDIGSVLRVWNEGMERYQ